MRGPAAAAVLALALAACTGARGPTAAPVSAATASPAPVSPALGLPPGWSRIHPLLRAGEEAQARGDGERLVALAPAIEKEGLALLKANMPSTLARHDVPRFLEARAAFGDALAEFARVREAGRVADLGPFLLRVSDAWHGWMAVVRGGPPERSL